MFIILFPALAHLFCLFTIINYNIYNLNHSTDKRKRTVIMSSFVSVFKGVSRNILDSVRTAASNIVHAIDKIDIPNEVYEINGRSNVDEVALYPVYCRESCLVLHGPIERVGVNQNTVIYNIILHVPQSTKMFSLFRTDQIEVAQTMFILYKETFPDLIHCDPKICEQDQLEKICKMLQENKGWTAGHVGAALGLQTCLCHPFLRNKLNQKEGKLLRTPLLVAIAHGNFSSIVILLEEPKVKLNVKDLYENTLFHLAASQSSAILKLLMEKVPQETQKELLDYLNAEGLTPLEIACKSSKYESIKDLFGANPDIRM